MHPVRRLFKTMPKPRPIEARLMYFESINETPEFWTLRVYRDEFETFKPEDKLVIHNWISDVIRTIRMIEPNMFLEVYESASEDDNGSQSLHYRA